MDEPETAPSIEVSAEVVSTPADTTPSLSSDDDSALEALYDKITAAPEAEEAAPVAAAAKPVPDQPQSEAPAPDANAPASGAPHSWSAEKKALWDGIPPEAREYIAQRETAAHEQISRMGQEVARYRPVGELLDAHQEMFDRNGFAPIDGIKKLFEAQTLLEQNPVHGIAAIADQFGIDLAATFGGKGEQQGNSDPRVGQLEQQNRQLNQRLAQFENTQKANAEREAQARREEAKSTVTKWSEGKTHFAREDVKKLMGTLMGNGQAATLDEAYEKATYAIPDVRSQVLADQKKAEDTKKLADDAKAVAEAKKAKGMNGGSRPGQPAKGTKWDDDAYLEGVLERVG
jgi:hypothetical protein